MNKNEIMSRASKIVGKASFQLCPYDLRTVEIWYQLCWYLDKLI